jgi:hypothetical protein
MSEGALDGDARYAPVDLAEAARVLLAHAGVAADAADAEATADIALLVGREPPALRWAGLLARTVGWGPLRQRLQSWARLPGLVAGSDLPWRADVERARDALEPAAIALLATLAACDGPFAWDVLEEVEPAASIASICLLEDAGLLARSTRAGVVTFAVPFCVRALHRLAEPEGAEACARLWLAAWVKRAEALRASTYGVSSGATLSELAFAVPLAHHALASETRAAEELGLALWIRVADAMFFVGALDLGSPAFDRAVTLADASDASDALEPRVRARIVAGRAALERGDPAHAEAMVTEAVGLAASGGRDDLRSEALRGAGWTALASAKLEAARTSFEVAQGLAEAARDPRGLADATAGRGILALLTGETEAGRALLGEALAIHVVTRDAPREAAVRGMMALLPEQLDAPADAALLAGQLGELRASGQRWREALVLARLALQARARGDDADASAHLREARAAAALSGMSASALVATLMETKGAARPEFLVGFEGRSLTLPSGEVHDLTRHGPVRRVLWALAVARVNEGGVARSALELVDAGWPGEKMRHEAATLRVYTTVRRLRALGLADALVTRDDGYLFDPEAAIAIERP